MVDNYPTLFIFIKIMLLFSLVSLTGCEQNKPDLMVYAQKVKARPAPDIEPLPVLKPYEKFIYSAESLRNPFIKSVLEPEIAEEKDIVDNGIHPDENRLKEALESYSLSELQFVGTLSKETPWVLIRSPDGVIHRVQKGNYMGQNHGQIVSISDNEVTLKEIVPEPSGGFVERDTIVSLIES